MLNYLKQQSAILFLMMGFLLTSGLSANLYPLNNNTIRPSFTVLRDAIIQVESNGKRLARGRAGERGLMQVTYQTWKWTCRHLLGKRYSWDLAYNSEYNIEVGSAYLRYCVRRMGSWELGVKAYNKGVRGAKLGRGNKYLKKVQQSLTKIK